MRLLTALLVTFLAAAPGFARAADAQPGLPSGLTALLVRPDHLAALRRAAYAVNPPGNAPCPTANYATTGEVGVLGELRTDDKGKPIGGAIKESMQESGCGLNRRLNALTVISPNGALQTQALLPGTTITDPQLQEDSVPYAAGSMGEMPAGCDQGAVIDTRFVGVDGEAPGVLPARDAPPRPWTEVWTLQACARRAEVTMHFTPDPTGTEIRGTLVGR